MKKVLLAASSGGHLDEISNLDLLGEHHEVILLTEKTSCGVSSWYQHVYYVPQVNRKEWLCIPKLLLNAFRSLRLMCREKPDVVISIGALATIPVCLIAKLMRRRVLYIETFARIDSPSLTGKLLYKIADKTIIQWKELAQFYPDAIYGGSIY